MDIFCWLMLFMFLCILGVALLFTIFILCIVLICYAIYKAISYLFEVEEEE